jgi:hypothetical protein
MADNKPNREDAAQHLGAPAGAASTIDAAFGPNWDTWQQHVVAHVPAPDDDNDGEAEMDTPVVPLLVYGDGPNSYISTDFDAGQVIVRDGNDRTGKAWKWPMADFMRFVAAAHGKTLPGDPEETGDNPYEAAAKQNARTAKLVEGERNAAKDADGTGRTSQSRTGK